MGRRAYAYHAGLDAAVRERNQEHFLKKKGVVIAATIGFGNGDRQAELRFVAHLDVPKNLEATKETARAERDGLPADAWTSYGPADVMNLVRLLDAGEKSPSATPN